MLKTDPIFIVIDLFCGAGGTTTGFVLAELEGNSIAEVIACVNHDPKAIRSHWWNYPGVKHFEEDMRTLDLAELISLVQHYRLIYPDAYVILWASLECTNFSKAKGGLPRDADSRTLADHLDRYVVALNPDYVQIENVVEFMSWGPLDEKGKPISRKNGRDWMRWRKKICSRGYTDQWKELNSANYGAYTSRNRLFGVFAKAGLPIVFPEPTHAKIPSKFGMHGDLKKWMPVKDVLDFSDEGISIFTRQKPLSEKTLERIYAGLIKYVAKGDTAFISKYYSGKPSGKNISVDGPAGTLTCIDGQALVNTEFLLQTYAANSKGHNTYSPDNPARTVTTRDATAIIQPKFLTHYYSGGGTHSSVNDPAPTVTTKARSGLVQPEFLVNYNHSSDVNDINDPAPTLVTRDKLAKVKPEFFIDKTYTGYKNNQSINQPAGAILTTDKHRLVRCEPFIMPTNYNNPPKSIEEPSPVITANRKHHYLVNPSWGGNPGSIDEPCPVIVARQDKAPLYFVQVEKGSVAIAIYDIDSPCTILIKQFMAAFDLVDIKMRMLRVHELLKIQGFPNEYRLEGTQADKKKFIGNSVVPQVVKSWTEALAIKLIQQNNEKVA